VAFTLLPYLEAVDDVLPEDVAAGTDGRQGIQVDVGNPDGEGGILLSQRLTGLHDMVEVVADEAPQGKLNNAEDESQGSYHEQQPKRGIGMNDVLHRCSCNNHQRGSPQIVREVLYGDDPLVEAMHVVLHHIRHQHRHQQYDTHLIQYFQKCRHERNVSRLFYQGEEDGYQYYSDEVGDERVGCHLLQRTAQLELNVSFS